MRGEWLPLRMVKQYEVRPTLRGACGCFSLSAATLLATMFLLAPPISLFGACGCCGDACSLRMARYGWYTQLLIVTFLFPATFVLICYLCISAFSQRRWYYLLAVLVGPLYLAIEIAVLEILRSLFKVLEAGGTGWERQTAEELKREEDLQPFLGGGLAIFGGGPQQSSLLKSDGFIRRYFTSRWDSQATWAPPRGEGDDELMSPATLGVPPPAGGFQGRPSMIGTVEPIDVSTALNLSSQVSTASSGSG